VQDYHKQFCWLHGSGHIPAGLAGQMNIKCQAEQNDNSDPNERHTHYYLWIPFVLALLLIIIKAPQIIWEDLCERGFVEKVVKMESGTSMIKRFRKLRKKMYTLGYFGCEVLNIVSVILCFSILDSLFDGKFRNYGTNVLNYDKTDSNAVDPKCNLFPTEVSCNVQTGGIDGNADENNFLCLLSNNLFNQYYFLILWWWWVTLLALSLLGVVYRLSELLSVEISRRTFMFRVGPLLGKKDYMQVERMDQWDLFLMGNVCQNLKGSQIKELIASFNDEKEKEDIQELEKAHRDLMETKA